MKVGCKVKIDDIGPLATCVGVDGWMVHLELEGELFWMPARLLTIEEEGRE